MGGASHMQLDRREQQPRPAGFSCGPLSRIRTLQQQPPAPSVPAAGACPPRQDQAQQRQQRQQQQFWQQQLTPLNQSRSRLRRLVFAPPAAAAFPSCSFSAPGSAAATCFCPSPTGGLGLASASAGGPRLLRSTYATDDAVEGYLVLGQVGDEQHCKPQTRVVVARPLRRGRLLIKQAGSGFPMRPGTPPVHPWRRRQEPQQEQGQGLGWEEGEYVAIKITNLAWARRHQQHHAAAAAGQRPLGEAAALGLLPANPHVMPLLEAMEDEEWSYLVFPYAEEELFEVLVSRYEQGMPEAEAQECIRQLVLGLLHMKRHGLAHGDISLENVLLHRVHGPTSPPVLRLIDLEMARFIPTPATSSRSRRRHQRGAAPAFPCNPYSEEEEEDGWGEGEEEESKSDDGGSTWGEGEGDEEQQPPSPRLRCVVGGKPNYCAPECTTGRRVRDWAAADVWSLGVVTYMLLTGRPLYAGPEDEAFALLAAGGAPGLLHFYANDYGLHIPPMAHHLLSQILRPHPQDRPTLEQILTHPWLHNNPNNLNPSFSTAPARVASEPSFATAAEQKQPEPCSHKQSPATLVAGWGFIEGEEEEDGTGETDGEGGSEGGWEVGGYCDPGLDGGEQEEEEGRALWRWVCGEGAEGEIGAATPSLLASAASALAAYADGGMISVASSESL